MRIKIIFHITRMDDVSDVLKKAEELKKEKQCFISFREVV